MTAYYNEIDPYAASWLERLIAAGHIAPGVVDRRSVADVRPEDLRGFTQCHFFAGIGGWSLAARLAGWSDNRPFWSASLPCQPYSIANVAAGGGRGQEDERHLLPQFLDLVEKSQPAILFGEQVANAIKWGWLDQLFEAMEGLGYACASAILPAIAVRARHERKRIYWMADAGGTRWERHKPIECVPVTATETFTVDGDSLARAWGALDGDFSGLLPCDGLSVVLERSALKGYGNAIVPPLAAEFIRSYMEITA